MAIFYSGFVLFVVILLALDLGVFHRKDQKVSTKEALFWTLIWASIAIVFNGFVYLFYENHWLGIGRDFGLPSTGADAAVDFFTAYIIEKSLSIDNIFVIAMIFSYFKVPGELQHRVLFWGIFGALVMRAVMIFSGIAAVQKFSFLTYVLGGFLILTALKMMVVEEGHLEPEKNPLIKLLERFFPITKQYFGHQFFVKIEGKWAITPLCLALVMIESMDLIFAVDSIPAVLAITLDPFVVLTSNVFAILGMRSLYFALASMMDRFRFLKLSLIFVLLFVGLKMMLAHYFPISALISLIIVVCILALGIIASLCRIPFLETPTSELIGKEIDHYAQITLRTIKRVFIITAGFTLLISGVLMLVTPGPGVLVIFMGLALLAVEFVWARVLMNKVKNKVKHLQENAMNLIKKAPKGKEEDDSVS